MEKDTGPISTGQGFSRAGLTFILSKNEIAAKLVGSYIFEPDMANYTSDLLSSAQSEGDTDYDIQQYEVRANNPYLNKSFGEAFLSLKTELNVILIGIARMEEGKPKLHKVPDDDFMIREKDHLIMSLTGHGSRPLGRDLALWRGSAPSGFLLIVGQKTL